MKLIVERIKNLPEVEVLVRCKETPEKETENLIAYLEQYSLNLIGSKAGATYPVSPRMFATLKVWMTAPFFT